MKPAEATAAIRGKCTPDLRLYWTNHAKERLFERDLIMGDILHVLKHGFVHDEAQPTTRSDVWKYPMQCVTPNSGGRTVKIIVIPVSDGIKVVTVMWADER